MKTILCFLLLIAFQAPATLSESQKIDRLILFVQNSKDVVFVRNGSEYPPSKAAEHLRMKRENAGSSIKTARQFIKEIASTSSMSGQPYLLKYRNGKTAKVSDVLYQYLDKLEKGQS